MRVASLITVALVELYSVYAIPMPEPMEETVSLPAIAISHALPLVSRDFASTDVGGQSIITVIVASVVFGLVIIAAIVAVGIMYFKDRYNCCSGRKQKKERTASIHSSTALRDEDAVVKEIIASYRPSFVSERESITYSRSRSSSVQHGEADGSEFKPWANNAPRSYQPQRQFTPSNRQDRWDNPSVPPMAHPPPHSPASESTELVAPSRTISITSDAQRRPTPDSYRHYSVSNASVTGSIGSRPILPQSHSHSQVVPPSPVRFHATSAWP